ncbi:MAG: PD-(D/E)XK nuclease family protein [Prevotellaceae bacterium]|jgi:CRISPR/Cas system-associated exonuclease Cas4 (RecB family)|nr:PD-(D/E)XK nuclease family protein [Prevotellaceae bacterium]
MNTFLEAVAQDLYHKFGNNLSRTAVVFPNKRAGLFFNEYLARQTECPLWSPVYLSISELMEAGTVLRHGDELLLISLLYRVYRDVTGRHDESLDDFYFWGELMLADFDDLDKNLTDARLLFANLNDLKQPENFDFLSSEQQTALQDFLRHFSQEATSLLKQRFVSLWDKLYDIYIAYRQLLTSKGIAYEGMLLRDSIERLKPEELPYERTVFVGFNALNKVEHRLFHTLQQSGKALFYWDYDTFYTRQADSRHEAGIHIRQNMRLYPNELPPELFDNLCKPKQVSFIAASTENAQARFLTEWVGTHLGEREKETAVVLCNETLLLPVLHSIPSCVRQTNITMGFPMSHTPAYTMVTQWLKDEATQPHDDTLSLCRRLVSALAAEAENYRTELCETDTYTPLYREALFKCYTVCNRLATLMEEEDVQLKIPTFAKLLQRVLARTHIPFHGEPAVGMQIMGVLETRNIDFRHLLILSFNEGKLPKKTDAASFIPYSLRKAFGMSTVEQQDSMYAYYFYRLIQRAETVTCVYNTADDGVNRGEASRFLLQLQVEWPYEIHKQVLETQQSPHPVRPIQVKKKPCMAILKKWLTNGHIAPSALNIYMDCRLHFYYRYIARIKEPDEQTLELDSATFGTIFHKAMENIYKALQGDRPVIRKENIEDLIKDKRRLEEYVHQAFCSEYFRIDPETEKRSYTGTELINRRVITTYAGQVLRADARYAPFTIVGMEERESDPLSIHVANEEWTIHIGGTIDRIDLKDGVLRIVDYKTGGNELRPNDISDLFDTEKPHRPNYIFQTFLYADLLSHRPAYLNYSIRPALFYVHKAANTEYEPVIEMGARNQKQTVTDYRPYAQEFRAELIRLLEELCDPDEDFTQTAHEEHCAYCAYRALCGKTSN